jgi:hypothetical protein
MGIEPTVVRMKLDFQALDIRTGTFKALCVIGSMFSNRRQ